MNAITGPLLFLGIYFFICCATLATAIKSQQQQNPKKDQTGRRQKMEYYVKTRNWNCKMWLWLVLATITKMYGGKVSKDARDFDGKFWLTTKNRTKAQTLETIYKKLSRYSGGMVINDEVQP